MSAGKRPELLGEGVPDGLRAAGRSPHVLALHGFTGTPQEVALVLEVARELGLGAEAPLLPGHGHSTRELASSRFSDWLAAAEEHYRRLAASGPVVVAGLSMGAVLALRLAASFPETTVGVVALANAVWLGSPWPTLALKLIDRLRLPDFALAKAGPDLGDSQQRAMHLTHSGQPIRAAISLVRGGEATIPELPKVRAPALLLHGAKDRVTPVANASRVAALLGSVDKRTVVFERSHHILTRDVEREEVRAEITAFLKKVSSGA